MSTLPDDYVQYPKRGYGQDNDRYDWSILPRRKPVTWPNEATLAVFVTVALQFYPLDQKGVPFKVPGGMTMPYPDLRHFSLRDYGNRVGIFRIMDALDAFEMKASAPINAKVAERYPSLVKEVVERGWEVMGHGLHMDALHYTGLDPAAEEALVKQSLETLRRASGQAVTGWLSPAKSQSFNTPDILAANGIRYMCDWANDDMPYTFRTKNGDLLAMPHVDQQSDFTILLDMHHDEDSYVEQQIDQFETLYKESQTQGGRIMSLVVHPWLLGQPHRISAFEAVLAHIAPRKGVWVATGADILDVWAAQQA
jgi:peptidoglycan/xylan/chitin deacetylase (PgdA/CDA1 family)